MGIITSFFHRFIPPGEEYSREINAGLGLFIVGLGERLRMLLIVAQSGVSHLSEQKSQLHRDLRGLGTVIHRYSPLFLIKTVRKKPSLRLVLPVSPKHAEITGFTLRERELHSENRNIHHHRGNRLVAHHYSPLFSRFSREEE